MSTDAKTGLTFWPTGAIQQDTLFNALLRHYAVLGQLIVKAIETTPPTATGSGDAYIVGASATGAWAGQDDNIAYDDPLTTAWVFLTPFDRCLAFNIDDGVSYRYSSGWSADNSFAGSKEIGVAVSDESTDLTTGIAKLTFRMPYPMALSEVRASVNTAPTGAALSIDVNKNGVSIFSTTLTIDAGEKTSVTAAVAPVISTASLADDDEITVDIDQVGSTVPGKGLKLWLIGTKA